MVPNKGLNGDTGPKKGPKRVTFRSEKGLQQGHGYQKGTEGSRFWLGKEGPYLQRNGWPADVFITNYHQFILIHRHIMHHYAAICHRPVQSHWYALIRSVFAGFRDLSPSPCLSLVASPSKKSLNENKDPKKGPTMVARGSAKKAPNRDKGPKKGPRWPPLVFKNVLRGSRLDPKKGPIEIMVRQRVPRRSRFKKVLRRSTVRRGSLLAPKKYENVSHASENGS